MLGLKAVVSTTLNPHAVYSKQLLKDKSIQWVDELNEKHIKISFRGEWEF